MKHKHLIYILLTPALTPTKHPLECTLQFKLKPAHTAEHTHNSYDKLR